MRKKTVIRGKTGADDAPGFDEVYREYLGRVFAYVSYRIGQRHVAEDLTAHVFEKAFRSWPRFDPEKAMASTWLLTIARNEVTDHLRRQSKRAESSLDQIADIASNSRDDDPVTLAEEAERARLLAIAIAGLEEREREIVSLKFGGQLGNAEIAKILGISESNAGTILYRSLRKLKTRLEGGIDHD